MGFPVGCSEMMLPRVLLQVLFLLGHLHRFLLWAFNAVGLGDLIDLGANYPLPDTTAAQEHHGHDMVTLQHRRPEFRPVPAVVIEEALPVVRFDELAEACGDGDCAVCLSSIGSGDEVRQLSNCRHGFHRGCLDGWMAHDQRTCPLCRAPLIPGELWVGAGAASWPDASDYDMLYPTLLPLPSTPLLMVPTPTLLRPHELLLNDLGGFQ
ncbi:brassinosteroid-responsive RING protein 1-like [Phragmites australis]|uniref:brassinosteroid-responsive RING protein 1-like n=1 Tax=Phragmites australis TaxID=29695 RepID=UPI002D79A519|nr:brassinosteroid-responsive RING protein 1-like [Phragmites australis]